MRELLQDARLYHRLQFQDQPPSFGSWLRIVLCSRGLFVLAVQRFANWYSERQVSGLSRALFKLTCGVLVRLCAHMARVLAKCEVEPAVRIGGGVGLSNGGHLVIGARSIGPGTIIHHRVTIGQRLGDGGLPEIGADVWIGPHCVIYGGITIGSGATVLPYTVVSKSVPPGVAVQGNPARPVSRNFDNSALRCNWSAAIPPMMNSANRGADDVRTCA